MNTRLIAAMFFGLVAPGLLFASDVWRKVDEKKIDGETIDIFDKKNNFEVYFDLADEPIVLQDERGKNPVWIFDYFVEHRRGVEVKASSLKPGDILLDPLMASAPKNKKHVKLLDAGTVLTEEDLTYVTAKAFRLYYAQDGTIIHPNSFKVGDVLALYQKKIDAQGQVIYIESGFRTAAGKTIIENGTTLNEQHVAMLARRTALPVRIRAPIDLNLEMYLRVDWPDKVPENRDRYWVQRGDQKLNLMSYQIVAGDVPLADIFLPDGTRICAKGKALAKNGRTNSVEVLDKHRDAVMLTKDGELIFSYDPITGVHSTYRPEPGELVLSASNNEKLVMPLIVKTQEDFDVYLQDTAHSYSRGLVDKDKDFPFFLHYTHYPIPFLKNCVDGCDVQFDAMPVVMKGKHHCKSCQQHVYFPPYVIKPETNYPYHNQLFKTKPILCGYCNKRFMYNQAKAHCANIDDGADWPKQALNLVHPSRLLVSRMGKATLKSDSAYYKNGEEIVLEKGTEISDELRKEVMDRALSPVYVTEPKGELYNFAQCPSCFGWNSQPLSPFEIRGPLGVDEVRKGAAVFDLQARRITKLELVVFGLNKTVEPTSGRSLAYVVTYRRYGDEHFQNVASWKLTSKKWKFLPRYDSQVGMNQPIAIGGGAKESSKEEFDF